MQRETAALIDEQLIEVPNVVTEAGFRMLLVAGHRAEVVCLEDPEFKNHTWRGAWSVQAISPDQKQRYVIVVARANERRPGEIRTRVWKTAVSIVSFLHKYGADSVEIPMAKGKRCVHPPVYDPESGDPLPDWAD